MASQFGNHKAPPADWREWLKKKEKGTTTDSFRKYAAAKKAGSSASADRERVDKILSNPDGSKMYQNHSHAARKELAGMTQRERDRHLEGSEGMVSAENPDPDSPAAERNYDKQREAEKDREDADRDNGQGDVSINPNWSKPDTGYHGDKHAEHEKKAAEHAAKGETEAAAAHKEAAAAHKENYNKKDSDYEEGHGSPDERILAKAKAATEKAEKATRAIETGSRGGQFYISASGSKVYVKK